ncbi:MAG: PqqD family protein [Calditrichaeota bacterium]|nr:MAG: PqqD family protein [Calditrichota bacterium]
MHYNLDRLKNFVISDTGFIFDPSTGEILNTNEVGCDILRCLQEGITDIDDIKQRILEKYDVDERTADKDIREFIPVLINLGLISMEDS